MSQLTSTDAAADKHCYPEQSAQEVATGVASTCVGVRAVDPHDRDGYCRDQSGDRQSAE